MKLHAILRNKTLFFNFLASGILNAAAWGVIVWLVPRGTEEEFFMVPLHYNIYFGIDLIGAWHEAFVMPASGLAIMAVNFVLGLVFLRRLKIVSYFFLYASSFAQLFVLVSALTLLLIS